MSTPVIIPDDESELREAFLKDKIILEKYYNALKRMRSCYMIFEGIAGRYVCPNNEKVNKEFEKWSPAEHIVEELDMKWSHHYANGACSKEERLAMLSLELKKCHHKYYLRNHCYGKFKNSQAVKKNQQK